MTDADAGPETTGTARTAAGRGPRLLVAAGCTIVFLAVTAVVLWLITFHLLGAPALFVWLLAVLLAGGAIALGRSLAAGLAGVLGAGVLLAILFLSGPGLVQSYVLQARGVSTTAVVTGVGDGNFVSPGSRYNRGRADTIATPQGRPLRGLINGPDHRVGARVTVLADPRGEVDSRLPSDVKPVTDTVLAAIGALVVLGVWYAAAGRVTRRRR